MKNKYSKIVRFVFSFLLVSSFFLSSYPSFAAFDVSDFDYRREITISENSGSNLSGYQVPVYLNTQSLISAGKMRSDCGDMRFIDGALSNEISYWIESGCNTSSTKIWVRIPSLAANSDSSIYVYYGSPSTGSASNASAVFDDWWENWKYQITNSCTGPSNWTNLSFNDYGWSDLPTVRQDYWPHDLSQKDFYMRKRIMIVGSVGTSTIQVHSDDGQWLYSGDGTFIGHCGGECHSAGVCSTTRDITSSLSVGENVIAVRCSQWNSYSGGNGEVCYIPSTFNIPNSYSRKYASVEPSISVGSEEAMSICNDGLVVGSEICDPALPSSCTSGEVCNSTCTACECAATCDTEGLECGTHELCGVNVDCGSCPSGQSCSSSGICEPDCGNGSVDSGEACDGYIGCPSGETCLSDCSACECMSSCSILGYNCGDYTFCGLDVSCGTCSSGQHCASGHCAGDYCGDGVVSGTETCDPNNRDSCPAAGEICNSSCSGCEEKIKYFDADINDVINGLISTLLKYVGGFALLLLVIAGTYYISVGNNPEMQTRARKMITYILIGMIVIMISYAILKAIESFSI